MENHAQRPEVVEARTSGLGRSRRSSASVKMDMLYVGGAGETSDHRVRPRRRAVDRRRPSGADGAHRDRDRARARAGRRGRHCLAVFDSHRPARPADRAGGAALRERRPHAAAARVRRRRARHRRARARRVGTGSRTPARGAGARSRAHGSDSRRHGRGRHRRRRAGTAAARERRGQADAEARRRRDRPPVLGNDPRPGDRRTGGRSTARSQTGGAAAVAAARPVAHDHGARGAGRRLGRARRDPRAARHHRPEARRSDPPRLRRQRVARAAHAADGDPRLRRSAVRGRHQRRRIGGDSWRSSAGRRCGWSGWSRICCGWRASTPARRRSTWSPATRVCSCRAVVDDLESAAEERAAARRGDDRAGGRRRPRRSGETPRRPPQPCRQRHHLLARAEHDPGGSGAGRRPNDHVGVR